MSFEVRYFGQHPSVVIGDAYETVSGGGSVDSSDGINDYGFRMFTPASITDELPSDFVRGFGFYEGTAESRDITAGTGTTGGLSVSIFLLNREAMFDLMNTGIPIEKVAQSAINGLPPLVGGFLDSESPFLSIYQQRYLTTTLSDEIAGGEGLNIKINASPLNYDLGGDADDDAVTFEQYLPQYAFAPYTGLTRRVTRLANKNISGYKRPGATFGIGGSDLGLPAADLSVADSITTGGTGGSAVYDLAPLVETTFSDRSRPLVTNEWFRTGTGMSDESYKFNTVVFGSARIMYTDEETGATYIGEARSAINKNTPFITDTSRAELSESTEILYTVYYDYQLSGPFGLAPADRYKVTNDIESRFRTESYVDNFSNALISDRMDKITALLGVSIDREADVKMQKNSPLSYNAISSIVADLQPDASTPVTVTADTSVTSPGPEVGETGPAGGMADFDVSSVGTAPGGSSGY